MCVGERARMNYVIMYILAIFFSHGKLLMSM